MNTDSFIRARSLVVEYDDGPTTARVFSDLSFEAVAGQVVAICGPSGSGKSSLLRILAGLQQPNSGHVDVAGRTFMVYQDARLVPFLNVSENLALAADIAAVKIDADQIAMILSDLGLDDFGGRMPSTLSGGEAHRVAVGRAFAAGASILLVDEPTASLDRVAAQQVGGLLVDLACRRNALVVVATHDGQLADRADSVVRLASDQQPPDLVVVPELALHRAQP